MNKKWFNSLLPIVLVASLALVACSSSNNPATPTVSLSGTAASGAAIIGTVTVKDALGATRSAQIEADGQYLVDVTGLTAPFRLQAVGTVGGRTVRLHSYAEAADTGGTVNITPFTDLIVANAAQQVAEAFFDSTTTTELDPAVVDAQETALQDKLQDVFTALGVPAAIDLLNSTFSADHSGLDAALDIVQVTIDTTTNVATITNLIEQTTITDNITNLTDTAVLTVNNPDGLGTVALETRSIVAGFDAFEAAFTSGVPTLATIEDLFSADFLDNDISKSAFLTDITTDPFLVGVSFNGLVVSELDLAAGTAKVTFSIEEQGVVFPNEVDTWLAKKDATLGWQMRGNQRIVDSYFLFHCNDNDGDGAGTGGCGINATFIDTDFSNNGNGGVTIASGTVKIIDGTDGTTVKETVYLGNPTTAAGDNLQIYNEASASFQGDFKGFGSGLGAIPAATFTAGDIIQFDVYTEALDLTLPAVPNTAAGAVSVATFTDPLLFAPDTVGKYPTATSAAQTAITDFTMGNNLTLGWTLAAGTRNDTVLVRVSDSNGKSIETEVDTLVSTATVPSTVLDTAAATAAGLDAQAKSYTLLVRIFTSDLVNGQTHSRDYTAQIPGPAATGGTPPAVGGSIIGSWFLSNADTPNESSKAVITFINDTEYFMAEDFVGGDPNCNSGMERGTYTHNATTDAFSITGNIVDTTADCGLHDPPANTFASGAGATATINNNTVNVSFTEGGAAASVSLTRVTSATNPLIGSWFLSDASGKVVVTFINDTEYFMAEDSEGDPNCNSGMEHGTYTHNATTGAFSITGNIVDTTADCGLHDPPANIFASGATVTVNNDTLLLSFVENSAPVTISFTRVSVPTP